MVRLKRQKGRVRRRGHLLPRSYISFKSIVKFSMALVLITLVGIGLVRLKYMFMDTEYFIVKEIELRLDDKDASFRNISLKEIDNEKIGERNIFSIDLNDMKQRIEKLHPEFKDIVVRRLLPNKLIVDAKLRKAVAQVRSDRYYFLDGEGVLLPDVVNFPDVDLPIITGVGVNIAKLRSSKFSKFERKKISNALNLINEIKNTQELRDYRLKTVDITDPGNISFFFESFNIEIKIGNSDFHERLKVLATVLKQIVPDIRNFKYIDLRFEDPIIGPR